jgi:hypothetical protein
MKRLCYALAALGLLFAAVGQAQCDSIYWTDGEHP